ncbi:MAG: hypothetical protein ACI9BV_003838, partial [Rhodothermales bacterium]
GYPLDCHTLRFYWQDCGAGTLRSWCPLEPTSRSLSFGAKEARARQRIPRDLPQRRPAFREGRDPPQASRQLDRATPAGHWASLLRPRTDSGSVAVRPSSTRVFVAPAGFGRSPSRLEWRTLNESPRPSRRSTWASPLDGARQNPRVHRVAVQTQERPTSQPGDRDPGDPRDPDDSADPVNATNHELRRTATMPSVASRQAD